MAMASIKFIGGVVLDMVFPPNIWKYVRRGFCHSLSDHLVFMPNAPARVNQRTVRKPSDLDMEYDEIWITTKDKVKLYGFLMKKRRDYPTLIIFHGNAGSIGDRLEQVKLLHQNMCLNLLLVEYRGYGPSSGLPSEYGLYTDAEAAFDYAYNHPELDRSKLFVFGQSLGGAVAIALCSGQYRDKVAGLIVENTFTSIPDLAEEMTSCAKCIPRCVHNNHFNNGARVQHLRCPTLFISSTNDEIVPPQMMEELFALCGSPAIFVNMEAKHNDAFLCDEYTETLYEFITANESLTYSKDINRNDKDQLGLMKLFAIQSAQGHTGKPSVAPNKQRKCKNKQASKQAT